MQIQPDQRLHNKCNKRHTNIGPALAGANDFGSLKFENTKNIELSTTFNVLNYRQVALYIEFIRKFAQRINMPVITMKSNSQFFDYPL